MQDEELARLLDALYQNLDALYQNLDTPAPEPGSLVWYETGVEESVRRAQARGEAI